MKNNKGFSIISFLLIIIILGGIGFLSFLLVVEFNEWNNLKKNQVVIDTVETATKKYLNEHDDKVSFIYGIKKQYQCIKVKDLMQVGYIDNEILNSMITEDTSVYVAKSLKSNELIDVKLSNDLGWQRFCDSLTVELGNEIAINFNRGWDKMKDVMITYTLDKSINQEQVKKYKYSYKLGNDEKKEFNFKNNTVIEKISLTKPLTILASIENNDGDNLYTKTVKISKVDSVAPVVGELLGDAKYEEMKNIIVAIDDKSLNDSGVSGFDVNDTSLMIQYGWSMSDKIEPMTYNNGKINYQDCNETNDNCTKIEVQILESDLNGDYYLWIKSNLHDMAGNQVKDVVSSGVYKFDNGKPSVSISGNAAVGEKLKAVPNHRVTDATYMWYSVDSPSSTNKISLGTKQEYQLTDNEVGKYVYVVAQVKSEEFPEMSVTSNVIGPIMRTYKAVFNANGATISFNKDTSTDKLLVSCSTNEDSCEIVVPTITRDNYKIIGWSQSPKSDKADIKPGSKIKLNGNKTFYAITQVLDDKGPNVIFETNGNSTYAKTHSTVITVTDMGGVVEMKYLWSTKNSTDASKGIEFKSGDRITKSNGNGGYYLCVYAKDTLGNVSNICSNEFKLDNTGPKCSAITAITGYPAKVSVTAVDNESGIANNGYYFLNGWATSSTQNYYDPYDLSIKVKDVVGNETICGTVQLRRYYRGWGSNVVCYLTSSSGNKVLYNTLFYGAYSYPTASAALAACKAKCGTKRYSSGCEVNQQIQVYSCKQANGVNCDKD